MPPSVGPTVVQRLVNACVTPTSHVDAKNAIREWRRFTVEQGDIADGNDEQVCQTLASEIVRLFPNLVSRELVAPAASALLEEKLRFGNGHSQCERGAVWG